jgi:hypothetical protein
MSGSDSAKIGFLGNIYTRLQTNDDKEQFLTFLKEHADKWEAGEKTQVLAVITPTTALWVFHEKDSVLPRCDLGLRKLEGDTDQFSLEALPVRLVVVLPDSLKKLFGDDPLEHVYCHSKTGLDKALQDIAKEKETEE